MVESSGILERSGLFAGVYGDVCLFSRSSDFKSFGFSLLGVDRREIDGRPAAEWF